MHGLLLLILWSQTSAQFSVLREFTGKILQEFTLATTMHSLDN